MNFLPDFLKRFYFSAWRWECVSLHKPLRVDCKLGEVCFYIVKSGHCHLKPDKQYRTIELGTGDHLILLRNTSHSLICEPLNSSYAPKESTLPCQLLLARFEIQLHELNQLAHSLSDLIQLPGDALQSIEPIRKLMYAECNSPAAGGSVLASRTLQLLFLQSLQIFAGNEVLARNGKLKNSDSPSDVLLDPILGRLIEQLHSVPESDWSVTSMARSVNMSRSAFAERFRSVVGQAPAYYLTGIRMRKATHLLQNTSLSVKNIARLVGYESDSAFSSAFKKRVGRSPIALRQSS